MPETASRERQILHVDMDAFFASVEQRDNPDLAGKPVLVGGSRNRGVVAAASYEARRFGIRSAMPIRQALQRCPQAICVRSRIARYREVSQDVFGVFREITPEVEGLSLDEAFLDVSASLGLFGSAVQIAERIRTEIRARTGLTASVGVAANKLVAKIASDLDKPDGLTVISPGQEAERLAPLAVTVLPGIGPRAEQQLKAAGIIRIGDLQQAPENLMSRLFGRHAPRMRERAHGIDQRPVVAWRDERSISAESTFDSDISDPQRLHAILQQLADKTASRLRDKELLAGVVQVKIRQSDFVTMTRQSQLNPASQSTRVLAREAIRLLDEWRSEHPQQSIRLLGVGSARLVRNQQLDLFGDQPAGDAGRVDDTVDAIRQRFEELGVAALRSASTLQRDD